MQLSLGDGASLSAVGKEIVKEAGKLLGGIPPVWEEAIRAGITEALDDVKDNLRKLFAGDDSSNFWDNLDPTERERLLRDKAEIEEAMQTSADKRLKQGEAASKGRQTFEASPKELSTPVPEDKKDSPLKGDAPGRDVELMETMIRRIVEERQQEMEHEIVRACALQLHPRTSTESLPGAEAEAEAGGSVASSQSSSPQGQTPHQCPPPSIAAPAANVLYAQEGLALEHFPDKKRLPNETGNTSEDNPKPPLTEEQAKVLYLEQQLRTLEAERVLRSGKLRRKDLARLENNKARQRKADKHMDALIREEKEKKQAEELRKEKSKVRLGQSKSIGSGQVPE